MEWWKIVIITILIKEAITYILVCFDEEKALYFALGAVYIIMWFITYPSRTICNYKRSKGYYQKHDISLLQYFFGKRVHTRKELQKMYSTDDDED